MKKGILILITLSIMGAKCADSDVYQEYDYSEHYEETNNMAIDLKDDATLTGRVIIDDTEYPNGKYKDADLDGNNKPIANTGTPFRSDERNDTEGFLGALLKLGGLDPSGVADAPNPTTPADSGQYLTALTNWFLDAGLTISETIPTATSPGAIIKPSQISVYSYPSGASSPLVSYLINGGLMFQGWVGDSATVFGAEAEFDIDIDDLTYSTTLIVYQPTGGHVLTGILPTSRSVISCDLLLRKDGTKQVTIPMSAFYDEGGTYLSIDNIQGHVGSFVAVDYTSAKLRIKYDPRYVSQP